MSGAKKREHTEGVEQVAQTFEKAPSVPKTKVRTPLACTHTPCGLKGLEGKFALTLLLKVLV